MSNSKSNKEHQFNEIKPGRNFKTISIQKNVNILGEKEVVHPGDQLLKIKLRHTKNWSDKLILIVEDDVNNHSYIEELLSDTSAKVVHAWNGSEAVEQVKKHSDISLVLMDIKMPVMDGYNATRVIKKIRPKLPVIAQTAFARSQDKENALAAGCDSYISKPSPQDDFLKLIGSYLI